ncbi:MAG: GAF domain-containing protein [Anaerolineae bacterium]|nr:GAF domain-containing protein [Anaerolineae bacterium]
MNSDNYTETPIHMILNNLNDITTSVMYAAEGENLEEVLERIAQVSKDLVGARYAALGIPDGNGGLRFFKVAGISHAQFERIGHLPEGIGLLGAIMHERRPIRLEDMREDPRSAGFCKGHPTMTSFLGVPVQVGGRLYGMLYLSDRQDGKAFTEEDQWLIETMAGYAALAIAGAELGEQQRRLTLLEERERIGMELHDGIIQSLYAIGMHLDLMRTSPTLDVQNLTNAIGDLNDVIEDIRRYILNLKTSNRQTIHNCLQSLVGRMRISESTNVVIDAPNQYPPFSEPVFEAICQIVHEAVSNAVRHANAKNITLSARQKQTMFEISVADDGHGFDFEAVMNQKIGLGLQNMIKRAHLYHGDVNIHSTQGEGTVLTIVIPI